MFHEVFSELGVCVQAWYLQVVLRVPVRVKDDAGVSCREVDPQPTSSGTQEENEAFRVGFAEAIDGCLPQVSSYAPVYPLIQVPAKNTYAFRADLNTENIYVYS